MKKNVILTAISIATCVFAAQSQATTISGGSFNNAFQTTEINQTGNLNYFDSNLGTLNSVSFSFSGGFTTTILLTNNATQSQNVRATSSVDLSFSSSNSNIATTLAAISTLSLSATTGLVNLATGRSQSFGPLTDSSAANGAYTGADAANFSHAGSGTFDISCTSLSGLGLVGGGGNVSSTQATSAGCGASVSYDYTPTTTVKVPEPATLTILGLGLAGMGFASRKRKSA